MLRMKCLKHCKCCNKNISLFHSLVWSLSVFANQFSAPPEGKPKTWQSTPFFKNVLCLAPKDVQLYCMLNVQVRKNMLNYDSTVWYVWSKSPKQTTTKKMLNIVKAHSTFYPIAIAILVQASRLSQESLSLFRNVLPAGVQKLSCGALEPYGTLWRSSMTLLGTKQTIQPPKIRMSTIVVLTFSTIWLINTWYGLQMVDQHNISLKWQFFFVHSRLSYHCNQQP